MVEDNDSEETERTRNKGVNVTSDSLPTESCNPATVRNLQNQVQNLINQMGPATPHLTQNSSSEADNEESIYETSIFSSVYKAKTEIKTKPKFEKTDSSTREISECSALPLPDLDFKKEEKHCCKNCNDTYVPPQAPATNRNRCCCCQCKTYYECDGRFTQQFHMSRRDQYKNKSLLSKLLCKKQKRFDTPLELYKMDITECDDHSPPRKLVFNLIENLPHPQTNSVGINTKTQNVTRGVNCKNRTCDDPYMNRDSSLDDQQKNGTPYGRRQTITKTTVPIEGDEAGRVDVYYFDHGNSGYYETTDCIPYIMTEMLADRTENYTTKFWAELFGTVHIGFSFITSFILQFFRFVLYSLIRPLTVGLTQLASDYFFKPCLTVLFNAVIQPPLIFLYNVATSLRDLCDPIAEGIGYFLREIAMVLRAIRVVEINKGGKNCISNKKLNSETCKNTTCELGSEIPKREDSCEA